jgi:tetratricopeptide (TPR) repeat protein
MGLLLSAVDVAGPLRWRWLLTDEETGSPLADHQVYLEEGSAELERFGDLYGYVMRHAAPDRRIVDGARQVAEAAVWAGSEFLGTSVVAAVGVAAEAGPVTVRVRLPEVLDHVSLWPVELASDGGGPLAARGDVCFVYDANERGPGRAKAAGNRLRILAVFSQSTQASGLALRRERYALSRLIRRVARNQAAVELRVVQYGATRERLREIADEGDGWDILHLSAHGAAGILLLEKADGSPDPVSVGDLVTLLRPIRRRVKLAVVSSCESAADITAETYRLLGLAQQAEALEAQAGEMRVAAAVASAAAVPGLARALARELSCAVVAMRYPVHDEFAIAFGDAFYERLLSRRQPVDVAMARALAEMAVPPSPSRPPVSLVTPVLLGAQAVGLRLDVPRGRSQVDPAEHRMAYFPAEPARFVGRTAAMARASSALAPDSGHSAVLLYGMAGAGKTTCALELAYRYAGNFAAAAYWQAPVRDEEWASALADFANRMEIQLAAYGFTMSSHIGTVQALDAFLPRLRHALRDSGVLLVLDSLETLLTPDGSWRDPRWERLIAALIGHDGESRVILTSRISPQGVTAGTVTLPVHVLSLDESVGLARELPNLRGLLHADSGPVRVADATAAGRYPEVGQAAQADRDRVRRVLRVVQGHPKLMELADAMAADRDRLDAQLAAAEQAANGQGLDAFFREGTTTLDPDQFLAALNGWTRTALTALREPARLMAQFLGCLEDGDRQSAIVGANWADVWRRLGRLGEPPEVQQELDALANAGLIQLEAIAAADGVGEQQPLACRMHPAVVDTAAAMAGDEVRSAADIELGAFWEAVAHEASDLSGGENSGMVVQAALAAVPYLLRQQAWNAAATLLEDAVNRDHSPAVAQLALSPLRRVAEATGATRDLAVLGRVLEAVDPAEAQRVQFEAMERALGADDFLVAASVTSSIITLLASTGKLADALELTHRLEDCARRAGLGPWSLAACQATRLQVLGMLGEHVRMLTESAALRQALAALPPAVANEEAVQPWNVYETVLDTTRNSAVAVADWQLAFELNAEVVARRRDRGASSYEIAATVLNDAGPLIRLGRFEDAGLLLSQCQRLFEDYADTTMLARVLSARASLEAALGHPQPAVDLEATALRLSYSRPESISIAVSHHNLAAYLFASGGDDRVVLCHRMAAALIFQLTGATHNLASTLRAAARSLHAPFGAAGALTLSDIVNAAEQTEGVRLGDLIADLCPSPSQAQSAFLKLLAAAAEPALIEADEDERQALSARPTAFADSVVAAVLGDPLARDSLDRALPGLQAERETAVLAGWVKRILAGADPAAELAALGGPNSGGSVDLMRYIAARLSR